MTTEPPLDELLERVKEAIANQPPLKTAKEEKEHTKCPHHFGYLSKIPKNTAIPEGCYFCSKIVDCIAPQ